MLRDTYSVVAVALGVLEEETCGYEQVCQDQQRVDTPIQRPPPGMGPPPGMKGKGPPPDFDKGKGKMGPPPGMGPQSGVYDRGAGRGV